MLVLTLVSDIGRVTSVLGWRPSSVRASTEHGLDHARPGRPRASDRYFGWLDTLVGSIDLRAVERGSDTFQSAFDPSICSSTASLAWWESLNEK